MATVECFGPIYYDFGFQGLAPGAAKWVSFHDDRFANATVVFTAQPSSLVGGSSAGRAATTTMSVSEVFISNEPIFSGSTVVGAVTHAGANLKNSGSYAVRYAALMMSVVRR